MSLHLGNLSPRIRKDELKRVFGRFGRCTIQLKEKFGFAVYDFRGDAERAIKTLKGRMICGEPVCLSWSKQQPKPLQRFARADRSRDMQSDRNFGNISRSRGDYSMSDKHLDNDRGEHKYNQIRDDRGGFNHNNSGAEQYDRAKDLLEEGGHVEPNQRDDGRWGEQVDIRQNGNDHDNQMRFDRSERKRGDERGQEYENYGFERLAGSPSGTTGRLSVDKNRRVHHRDNRRGHLTCFKCGAAGHKMRDCPLEGALKRESSYYSDRRPENDPNIRSRGWDEVGGSGSRSTGRLPSDGKSYRSARQPEIHSRLAHAEKVGVNGDNSPVTSKSRMYKRNDYNRKRQRERENHSSKTCDYKKSRVSPLVYPDHALPQLGACSKSKKSIPGSRSCSRSPSAIPLSHSASSIPETRAKRSRSRLGNSKSKSRSRSPSSSLSISLGRSLLPSPKNAEESLDGSSDGSPSPKSIAVRADSRQQFEPEVREENLYVVNRTEAGFGGCIEDTISHQLKETSIERQLSGPDSKDVIPTSMEYKVVGSNGTLEENQITQCQDILLEEREWSEPELTQKFKSQNADVPVQSEDLSYVRDDVKTDQLYNHGDSKHIGPPVSLLEQGNKDIAAEKFAAEKLGENKELQNGNNLEVMGSSEPGNDPQLKAPKSHIDSHLNISGEELCRVLKHYGLKHPEEKDQPVDVEGFFGSARLWPWEMIYYRRLKKGAISVENYARRLAQNENFGITDKYIRSSSGWHEYMD